MEEIQLKDVGMYVIPWVGNLMEENVYVFNSISCMANASSLCFFVY
jgi:hypothetical protein